jgi:8-oxo-dGTP pyrophosphatase MutT (NUDIX family)
MSAAGRDESRPARPWQVLGKQVIYHSPWVGLERWAVRLPDGSLIAEHHVVVYPQPAVGIVPRDAAGNLLLVEHYRFITDTQGWEIPAGGVDVGETIAAAGARELLEETGHVAERWQTMGLYYPSNGSSNQVFHVLRADELRQVAPPSDHNEVLDWRWFTPAEVRALLNRNAIQDGFSLTALLWTLAA